MERSENEDNADGKLIGSYVEKKDCSGRSNRIRLGKVVYWDGGNKLYHILYENAVREVLGYEQVGKILSVGDANRLRQRKRKLDQLASYGDVGRPNTRSRRSNPGADDNKRGDASGSLRAGEDAADDKPADGAESLVTGEDAADDKPADGAESLVTGENAADSSSDSCDYDQDLGRSEDSPIPNVPLPPSSGDISVPEEWVAHLFSVYNFLRSFSLQLFLSPFRLEDFVESLTCTVQNTIVDAIHLSLLRSLWRHLQTLSSEDNELATKCLRHCDWSLLDALTWPAILVGYLYVMGYAKWLDEKGFSFGVCRGEYYALPVGLKLEVLQILSDDVVDSAEIRTELDMREDAEEVDEYNVSSLDTQGYGPQRVHPRNSKTSACKNMEALESSIDPKVPISKSKVSGPDADTSHAGEDGNSDECRLCGMDGTLICCDGCPSAYHSRCIGLNKATLPSGSWFCPECTINKTGMVSSKIGRGTSGAEIFGADANGRLFLGTCNYLLVIGSSSNSEPLARYYNQDNVTDVLSVLIAAENAPVYADICRGISNYWEVPLPTMQSVKIGPNWDPPADMELGLCYDPAHAVLPKRTTGVVKYDEVNCSTNAEGFLDNKDDLCQKSNCIKEVVNGSSIVNKTEFSDVEPESATLTADKTSLISGPTNISEQLGSGSVVTNTSCSSRPSIADRLIVLETATCASASENAAHRKDAPSVNFLQKKELFTMSNEAKVERHTDDGKGLRKLKFPALFKPQAYVNQYIQGDVAASAAASLAGLASEDINDSDVRISSNPKKTVAANTALQMKAFAGATFNFFWLGFDRKIMEVPRERCGWCIACRAATTWKKGCLLNLAATNTMKRFARNYGGLRLVKHFESHVPIIAAQIAHMEESLRGLTVGPLSDVEYNKQWHKLAGEASSCKVLKFLLLELEKNIRGIVFCGDWTKVVDDWLVGISSAASGTGTSKRRGRRSRKQSGSSKLEEDSSDDWKNVFWWRGGKFSKIVFQRGALPSSVIKKASRQGGRRWISGINYPEGTEYPRRSRQYAWRASVELSKNVSQLALQVRYLDAHVRWKDLVRPEQSSQDGKGSDADAMAFRNAIICDKRIAENKIKYALTFIGQNHLPLRVTKNILEAEKLQDGSEKLWFFESHVPLYLMKEYEEKSGLKPMPRPHSLSILWRRHIKNKGDIYAYLMRKREEPSTFSCASCQQDVFLRNAARCSTCQGFCHKDCSVPSFVIKKDDLKFLFTCNPCRAKYAASVSNIKKISNTQISLKGPNLQNLQQPPQVQHLQPAASISNNNHISNTQFSLKGPNLQYLQQSPQVQHQQSAASILNNKKISNQQISVKGANLQNLQQSSRVQHQPLSGFKGVLQTENYKSAQPVSKTEISLSENSGFKTVIQSENNESILPINKMESSLTKNSVSGSNSQQKGKRRQASPRGVIWKQNKDDNDSGKEFRINYILLKGKDEFYPKPEVTCCLCKEPYRSDLTYVRCEYCPRWYHAEALQLEEAQISDLAGFKCLKCRKKPSHKCPYAEDYRAPDMETVMPPDMVAMHQSDTPKFLHSNMEDFATVDYDPLLSSYAKVEPIGEQAFAQFDGPISATKSKQKLSVRKAQVKHEQGANGFSATAQNGVAQYREFSESLRNELMSRESDSKEALLTVAEPNLTSICAENSSAQLNNWDSYNNFGYVDGGNKGTGNDPVEIVINEDIEYEPQTYFSFTELLASEDDQMDNQFDLSIDNFDNWTFADFDENTGQDLPPSDSSAELGYDTGFPNVQFTDLIESKVAVDEVPCHLCKLSDPPPELVCESCKMHIHAHCSLWEESKCQQWSCGNCRVWK